MIAKQTYVFQYLCWKCKRKHSVEQDTEEELKGLKCPRCNKTLFRVERAPGLDTDTTFMAGSHADDGFGKADWMRKLAIQKAKAAGVNVSGKKYCPQLNAPGENLSPEAWVGDKADVRRRCKELGVGCNGSVNVAAPQHEIKEKPYQVSESLLNDRMERQTKGKDLSPREVSDLREKTAKRLAGGL